MEIKIGDGVNARALAYKIPGNDTIYPAFNLTAHKMDQRLQDIKDMKFHSDDVIIVSYPRSGLHWTYEIIGMLLRQSSELEPTPMSENLLDRIGDERLDELSKSPAPRIICTHLSPQHFSDQITDMKPRMFYVIRNPKDTLVSLYHLQSDVKDGKMFFEGSWNNYFQLAKEDAGIYYGGWYNHVKAMEEFSLQHPDYPVHIISYENMKQNTEVEVSKIARFLGCDESIVPDVVKSTDVPTMKKSVAMAKMSGYFKEGVDGIIRRGQVGTWEETFTVAQNQQFNELFKQKMANSKLADLVRPYALK